eukprot:TRINITY_DN8974_c0_g1_i2.p1 TRINITY_DN8974_c0_g1~~TRINITY_DN8974_c0_g1_i2.p1  ORF type:complete len:396 (-),score=65.30 TRINITY_DN8974_c0_g1_i2:304-1491(-)
MLTCTVGDSNVSMIAARRWQCHLLAAAGLCCMASGSWLVDSRSCGISPDAGLTATAADAWEDAGPGLGLVQVGSKALKPHGFVSVGVKVSVQMPDTAADSAGVAAVSLNEHTTLAATQLSANLTSGTGTEAMDTKDRQVLFLAMLVMFLLYLMAGHYMGVEAEKPSQRTSELERGVEDFYSRASAWIVPRLDQITHDTLPAISGAFLGLTSEMPLLIPVKPLEERLKPQQPQLSFWGPATSKGGSDSSGVAWSIDVKNISGKKVLTLRQTKRQDGSLAYLEVLGRHGNQQDKVLAKMDHNLKLYTSEGVDFGTLVLKQSGSYELQESATGRHRWLITPNMQTSGHAMPLWLTAGFFPTEGELHHHVEAAAAFALFRDTGPEEPQRLLQGNAFQRC